MGLGVLALTRAAFRSENCGDSLAGPTDALEARPPEAL